MQSQLCSHVVYSRRNPGDVTGVGCMQKVGGNGRQWGPNNGGVTQSCRQTYGVRKVSFAVFYLAPRISDDLRIYRVIYNTLFVAVVQYVELTCSHT